MSLVISALAVSPKLVVVNQPTKVTFRARNTGRNRKTFTIRIKGGYPMNINVTLAALESKIVEVQITPTTVGEHTVTVGDLSVQFTVLPITAPVDPSGTLRMNMKSYGNHNAAYDARILTIKPQYVIDNPPHGLYGQMDYEQYGGSYADFTYLLQNIAGYHAAGIKIIGYISGGYEGAGGDDGYATKWYSLATNKMLITNMATLDHVDGVFIDEVSEQPTTAQKTYLKALSDHARSYGLIVWMNTGVDQFNEWLFTVADLMQATEAWKGVGQSLSAVETAWGSRISVTGHKSTYTAQQAYDLTINAWQRGIAYCYINTTEYTSIAPWFETYAAMLRNYMS